MLSNKTPLLMSWLAYFSTDAIVDPMVHRLDRGKRSNLLEFGQGHLLVKHDLSTVFLGDSLSRVTS